MARPAGRRDALVLRFHAGTPHVQQRLSCKALPPKRCLGAATAGEAGARNRERSGRRTRSICPPWREDLLAGLSLPVEEALQLENSGAVMSSFRCASQLSCSVSISSLSSLLCSSVSLAAHFALSNLGACASEAAPLLKKDVSEPCCLGFLASEPARTPLAALRLSEGHCSSPGGWHGVEGVSSAAASQEPSSSWRREEGRDRGAQVATGREQSGLDRCLGSQLERLVRRKESQLLWKDRKEKREGGRRTRTNKRRKEK